MANGSNKKPERSVKHFPMGFIILMSICFGVLLLRLWALQILEREDYQQRAEGNYLREVSVPALRGRIFDRNGKTMADNVPSYELIINYLSLRKKQREKNVAVLSEILNLPTEVLKERLQTKPCDRFGDKVLLRNMAFADVVAVAENMADLPGIQLRKRPKRVYPLGPTACHVLGHIGEVNEREIKRSDPEDDYQPGDDIGKNGIEKMYEDDLRGKKGIRKVQVSSKGLWKEDLREVKPNLPGADIELTIDADLQAFVDDLIAATPGALIVMNPKNGEILAMSSSPTFDPNMFCGPIDINEWKTLMSDKSRPLTNRAVAGVYPPGSVYKLVLAWAGLETGVITARSSFTCSGLFRLGSWKYRCHQRYGHGTVNIHEAIKHSCDIFFYELGLKLGIEATSKQARELGFGQKTGIDLPGEESGIVPDREWKRKYKSESWYKGDTVNASIGQGYVTTTPLQVICSYGALANGGSYYRPHLVRKITDYSGKVIQEKKTGEAVRRIPLSLSNEEILRKAFSAVVDDGGTGRRTSLNHVAICGKTGTAEAGAKGSDPHAWFVGYAPKEDPTVVVLGLLERGGHGGEHTAPIIKELFLRIFPEPSSKKVQAGEDSNA